MSNKIKLPQMGKLYWHYDDGKITPSRQEKVQIIKVVPYSQVSKEDRLLIQNEIEDHKYLYNDFPSHVVYGINLSMMDFPWKTEDSEIIYLPTTRGGWFGFGKTCDWNCGDLDIDGKLTQQINDYDGFDEKFNLPLFP